MDIPGKHAIELMKELVFEYKDVISNAEFIIDLLEIVLENGLMGFPWRIFPTFFWHNHGRKRCTNSCQFVYCKTRGEILKEKNKQDPKLIWPKHFQKIHRDGFGIRKDQRKALNTGFQNSTIW